MEYIGYLASLFIGLTLGVLGGGGSILTVPILVYLFGIEAENATTYSLFIVGSIALVGTYNNYRKGNLDLKTAMQFAIPSLSALFLVRKVLLPQIPMVIWQTENWAITKSMLIMIVFALLMIITSFAMIRNKKPSKENKEINLTKLSAIGFLVGFITGFLGAGGGFLIIPALLFFGNLPMKQAIGTSLFIIFINSLIGFTADFAAGVKMDLGILTKVTGLALIGLFIGERISKGIDNSKLKPIFGWFVLIMGIYIIGKELV